MIHRFLVFRYSSGILSQPTISRYFIPLIEQYLVRTFSSESSTNENIQSVIPNVSVSNIKRFLEVRKIEYFDGFTNLVAECSNCKKRSLFINKVSGFCICHGCRKSGTWINNGRNSNHENGFKLDIDEHIHVGLTSWESLSKSLPSLEDNLNDNQKLLLKNLNISKIPVSLLKKLNAKFDDDRSELCIPLSNKSVEVGYKRFGSDSELTFPASGAAGFIANLNGNDSAVIVPSLKDLVALSLYKSAFDIICLPYGQQKLPQEILPLFESYKKLVLWFDNDSPTWDNIRIFAKKLCEDRCYLISPTGSQASAHKAFVEGLSLSKIVDSARPVSHPSIITFSGLRQDVMYDLQNVDKVAGVKWKRFPALNNILKGHRRGELSILTGSTGCGKTTFMSEFSLDLAIQGVNTLWGSFEIKNQRLARTMLQQFCMLPLQDNMESFDVWADRFQLLPLYFMTFHGQQSLDLVMEVVEHATYVHDIAHVIIDNVQFMLGLTSSESGFLDRFYRQDALIGAFRNFATKSNCHVTLVIHPRKEKEGEMLNANSIFGGAKASQEADNIMIVQSKTLNSLKMKKYLQVAKNRYTGDLGLMPLDFDQSTLSFASKKDRS